MRGSITVFFSLIITMCCSLFFSMTEVVRIVEMNQRAKVLAQESVNSAFSEYQAGLWETYSILGLDCAYGTTDGDTSNVIERIAEFTYMNTDDEESSGSDFLRLQLQNASLSSYGLLTDDNGLLFQKQAASAAKSLLVESGLDYIVSGLTTATDDNSGTTDISELIEAANNAIDEAESTDESEVDTSGTSEYSVTEEIDTNSVDNPLTVYSKLSKMSWLDLVADNISTKSIDTSSVVSTRTLSTGTDDSSSSSLSSTETLLYCYYLTQEFGHYGSTKSDTCLDYELEYIIAGKSSDKANLETVVAELIGVRQVANMLTITCSPTMLQQTYNLAAAIAGITLIPALIIPVQMAIIAVWALVESILDVRTLLAGGKIALAKSSATWTSSLWTLGSYLSTSKKAKESSVGVTYTQYLTGFIAVLGSKKKGLRPLDLIEKNLQQQDDYVNLKMDNVVTEMSVASIYEGSSMFLSFVTTNSGSTDWYSYYVESAISY